MCIHHRYFHGFFSPQNLQLLLLLTLANANASALPQFINEFHYDNTGGDVYEYVEIAGVAGSDLSGWSLDFYNGNNGLVYMSWDLSGQISNQENGFGALSFSGNRGLQNGVNDGMALVDDLGQLVQFLSYEGTLTAFDGAAQGETSVDVGISEGSGTAVGQSIQLAGSGFESEEFSWRGGLSSFGELNAEQVFLAATNDIPQSLIPSIDEPVLDEPVFDEPKAQAVPEPNPLTLFILGFIYLLLGRMLSGRVLPGQRKAGFALKESFA